MDKMDDMLLRATLLMNGFGGSCKPTATELEKMRAEAKSLEMLSKQEENKGKRALLGHDNMETDPNEESGDRVILEVSAGEVAQLTGEEESEWTDAYEVVSGDEKDGRKISKSRRKNIKKRENAKRKKAEDKKMDKMGAKEK